MTIGRTLMTFVVAGSLAATSILPLSTAAYAAPGARDGKGKIAATARRDGNKKVVRKFEQRKFKGRTNGRNRGVVRGYRKGGGRIIARHNNRPHYHRGHNHGRKGVSGPAAVAIGLGIATLAIIAASANKHRN